MIITEKQLKIIISEVLQIKFSKDKTEKQKKDLIEDLFKILGLNK